MGLCLAERIWEAHPVKLDANPRTDGTNDSINGTSSTNGTGDVHRSSSVSVHDTLDPAIVGVSRIWTCGSARRRGIGMDLLDCVISNFIYGLDIPKEQIAFTQPTESGLRLAECFFGVGEPWHVYNEGPCVS